MKTVKIDFDELVNAFENCSMGNRYFLNIEESEMVFISEDTMLSEEVEEEYNKMDDASECFIPIPERDSSENFREMEDFADMVENKPLRKKLALALDGKGAFRRFKDVLSDYPKDREVWFKYKNEKTSELVHEWLKENDLKIEE